MGLGSYLIYFLLISIVPMVASAKVRGSYNKYSKIASSTYMSGHEVARKILDSNGLHDVQVEEIKGFLSDHYDPRSKVVRLSSANYHGHSLASTAVSAHEVGHALQDEQEYAFLRFRSALVPVANFGSNAAFILLLIGMFLSSPEFALLGIFAMAAAVLFQVVTLPVEFNASTRAMDQVVGLGIIQREEESGAKKVLSAAALTYVAAAAVALMVLLRFVLIFMNMSRDE